MTVDQMQRQLIAQLDAVLAEFRDLRERADDDSMSGLRDPDMVQFLTRARAAIHRVAGRPSVYVDQCEEILSGRLTLRQMMRWLAGVLRSLHADVSAGYLKSHTELVHGELFADFLEMSQHLLDEGYKDAAAVITGSSLEAHLRQLCQKYEIDTETETGLPKKADRLNADLAKADVYSKLDQKAVTAWMDRRNKAAHGNYGEYTKDQVALLISGIRDFIIRHPA